MDAFAPGKLRSRLPLVLTPLLVACVEGGATPDAAVVRDSAGVAVVENPPPAAAPVYALSARVLEIGEVAGREEYELHDVGGVVPLSDGGVAVATGGGEIRRYGSDGRFRGRLGGPGDGPGEFRRIRYMRRLRGDSLLVFDGGNGRVTVLAPDGTLARDETLPSNDERPTTVAAALADGTLLTRTVTETPPASTPLYRPGLEFSVRRGAGVRALRSYPGPEAALHVGEAGGGIGSVFISVLPFARAGHAAAGPDRFFVGSSDAFAVDVWDAEGRHVRAIRVEAPVRPVTDELMASWVEAEVERRRRLSEERGRSFDEGEARRELRAQQHAPAVPAFAALLPTEDGGLWVKEFAMPGAEGLPQRWTIFDAEGRIAGTIDLPARFTPLHIAGGVVWGVTRDALDVPFVHAYGYGASAG